MDEKITIKQLSEELGISKQAVRKYFDKVPTRLVPTKVGGVYLINPDTAKFIRDSVNQVDTENYQPVDTSVDTQVDTYIQLLSEEKDRQIEFLKKQNETVTKLLDQQQQLTLQANKQIEQLQTQLQLTTDQTAEEESTESAAAATNQESDTKHELTAEQRAQIQQEATLAAERMVRDLQDHTKKKSFWERLFNR